MVRGEGERRDADFQESFRSCPILFSRVYGDHRGPGGTRPGSRGKDVPPTQGGARGVASGSCEGCITKSKSFVKLKRWCLYGLHSDLIKCMTFDRLNGGRRQTVKDVTLTVCLLPPFIRNYGSILLPLLCGLLTNCKRSEPPGGGDFLTAVCLLLFPKLLCVLYFHKRSFAP